jgi:hypothetical protein
MTQRDPVDVQKELIAHAFGHAQAYTNVVLSVGYAGFFAIWSFLKPDLSKGETLWSALLVSVSLTVFILWEVYQSFYRSRSIMSLAETVKDPSRFEVAIDRYRREENSRVISLKRVWVVAFLLTVVTGFGGTLILIYAFIRSLIKLYAA